MREAVSEIILERNKVADGASRAVLKMLVLSLAAHALLVVVLVFAPNIWTSSATDQSKPMLIDLGGAEGPDAGGLNTIAAKAVQRVAEPNEKPARPTPPAEKAPEMVAPTPVTKPAPKTPAKPIDKPAEKSSTQKPTAGKEIAPGAARADTNGAAIPFGGLTTGGGGTGGARVDVSNFCCQPWLISIVSQIKRNWSDRQSVKGQNIIKFVVMRDGTITGIEVDKSGGELLDISSARALRTTKQVTPLPREFTGNTLTIYLQFDYTR